MVNRLRTCAEQKLCVIRYTYDDDDVKTMVCHLSNIKETTACARWYAVVDEDKCAHDMVACPFLPGCQAPGRPIHLNNPEVGIGGADVVVRRSTRARGGRSARLEELSACKGTPGPGPSGSGSGSGSGLGLGRIEKFLIKLY